MKIFVLLALRMSGEASSIRVKAHILKSALHAAVVVKSPNGIGVALLVAIEFNNTSLETIIIPSTLVSETTIKNSISLIKFSFQHMGLPGLNDIFIPDDSSFRNNMARFVNIV